MDKTTSYLLFLRYCLSDNMTVPNCVAEIDWHGLLDFAKKQSIAGIYGHTILSDNKELNDCGWKGNKPDAKAVMAWLRKTKEIKERNKKVNKYCIKTTEGFTKAGYRSCIIKGQGNNIFYKDPYIRTSGDIDIWVDGDRWELFKFVKDMFPDVPFKCQHIELPIWKDIPVELHFYPMYLENLWSNRKLMQFYKENKEKQFANNIYLPGEEKKVSIPNHFFNAIFQLTHINVHILIEGIGLRQFIDYYYVLKNLTEEERISVCKLVKKLNIHHLAASVMYIEKEILGLNEKYLYIKPDEKRGRRLMKEIEICGNFGKYDKRMNVENESFWHRQIRKIIKNSKFIYDYPSEELSEPFFRIIHFIWRQWYKLRWKIHCMTN